MVQGSNSWIYIHFYIQAYLDDPCAAVFMFIRGVCVRGPVYDSTAEHEMTKKVSSVTSYYGQAVMSRSSSGQTLPQTLEIHASLSCEVTMWHASVTGFPHHQRDTPGTGCYPQCQARSVQQAPGAFHEQPSRRPILPGTRDTCIEGPPLSMTCPKEALILGL